MALSRLVVTSSMKFQKAVVPVAERIQRCVSRSLTTFSSLTPPPYAAAAATTAQAAAAAAGTTTTAQLQNHQQQPTQTRRHLLSTASLVPMVLESSAMGERSFDIFSRLLRERIICVHGPITDLVASLVTAQLLFLEADHPDKPLFMYINSPGGVVTAGMAIYDTMQYILPDVHTICMGQAASMGSLLLAGGAHGYRFSLPNSRIMLHQPSGGASGMASDIEIAAKEILRTRANLNRLYVHHTGQPLTEIERVMDRDNFMDVQQAMEFGIIDKVLYKRATPESTDNTSSSSSSSPS